MARYRMTAKRRAALRKAQLASARKRKKKGGKLRRAGRAINRNKGIIARAAVAVGSFYLAAHQAKRSVYSVRKSHGQKQAAKAASKPWESHSVPRTRRRR